MKKILLLALGLTSLVLCRCKKSKDINEPPVAGGNTLAKGVFKNPDGSIINSQVFEYDNNNRIVNAYFLDSSNNVTPNDYQTFTYDAEGKCVGSKYAYIAFWTGEDVISNFTFLFDDNGNIIKTFINTLPSKDTFALYSFTYNANAELTSDTTYYNSGNIEQYSTYTYNDFGNVASINYYAPSPTQNGYYLSNSNSFIYDMHPNPYYKMNKLFFVTLGPSGPLYLSKSNYITTQGPNATVFNTYYSYYSNGLPYTVDSTNVIYYYARP